MPHKSARRSVKQCNVLALHADVRPWEMGPGGEPLEDRDHRYVPCVSPKTEMQRQFIEAIDAFHLVLALGPAGPGKTYRSIAKAVEALEAGESIGCLPGGLQEKCHRISGRFLMP